MQQRVAEKPMLKKFSIDKMIRVLYQSQFKFCPANTTAAHQGLPLTGGAVIEGKANCLTGYGLIFVMTIVSVFFSCLAASAETWGTDMFRVKKHDFGRVAIGGDAVYRFEIENIYQQDVKILGVHSSCACTIPSLSTNLLKSGEKGTVIAKFNTGGQLTREKSAVITVNLETIVNGKTLQESVQLFVSGYIRPDIVLTPGIVEFGAVREGQSVIRTVQMEYAGRNDWMLTKVARSNPHIHAKAEEIKRSGGEVAYRITVTIKSNTPVGYVKDVLRFTTNEQQAGQNSPSEILLPIQGVVTTPVQAKPSPFMVGVVSPGDIVSKNIVVRSEKPFRIQEVTSQDNRFRFTFSEQESAIQLISVLFSAKKTQTEIIQNLSDKIQIRTNLSEQEFITLDALVLLTPNEQQNGIPPESAPEEPTRQELEPIPFSTPEVPITTTQPVIKAKFGTPKLTGLSLTVPE
jgi:hypothetical protein